MTPIRRQRVLVAAVAATVVAADQVTKSAAAHPARNADLSLQLASASRWTETTLMAIVLVGVVAVCIRCVRRGWLPGWVAGAVVGGCLGNLIDRALLGSVRDFFPIGHVVLNVADVAVFLGVAAAAVAHHRHSREGR